MAPTFWLTIQVEGRRILLPLPLILPLILVVEILALLPVAIYSIRKREPLPLRIVSGFYLSRFILVFILRGRKFRVNICDSSDQIQIAGRRLRKLRKNS
jgi:hypothetical protein